MNVSGLIVTTRQKVPLRGALWINFAGRFEDFWRHWHALTARPAVLVGLEDREFAGPLGAPELANAWAWLTRLPGFYDRKMPRGLDTAVLMRDILPCPWGICGECQHSGWLPRGHHYFDAVFQNVRKP